MECAKQREKHENSILYYAFGTRKMFYSFRSRFFLFVRQNSSEYYRFFFYSFLHLFKVDLLNALIRLRDLLLYAPKILQVQKAKVNQPFQQKHQAIFRRFFFSFISFVLFGSFNSVKYWVETLKVWVSRLSPAKRYESTFTTSWNRCQSKNALAIFEIRYNCFHWHKQRVAIQTLPPTTAKQNMYTQISKPLSNCQSVLASICIQFDYENKWRICRQHKNRG